MSLDPLGLAAGFLGVAAAVLLPIEWGVLAILLTQQMPWAGEVVAVGGLAIRPPDLALAAWLLKVAAHVRRHPVDPRPLRSAPVVAAAGWAIWALLATVFTHWREGDLHGGQQLVGLARLYEMMLILPVSAALLTTARTERARGLVVLVAAMAGLQALAAFSRWVPQALLGFDWMRALGFTEADRWFLGRDPVLAFPIERAGRLTGTFGDPAAFGDLMVIGVAAAWALARSGSARWPRTVGAVLVAAAGLSLTRASWVGLAVVAFAGWILSGRARPGRSERRRWATYMASGVAAWVLLLSIQSGAAWIREEHATVAPVTPAAVTAGQTDPSPSVATGAPPASVSGASGATAAPAEPARVSPPRQDWMDRLQSRFRFRFDRSAQGRVQTIRLGLEQFAEHPLTGVGWTGGRFHGLDLPWGEPLYTRLLAETGIAGFALFLGMLAAGVRSAWRGLRGREPATYALACFSGLGLAAFTGFMVADLLILGPSLGSAVLFLLLACAAAAEARAGAEEAPPRIGRTEQSLC